MKRRLCLITGAALMLAACEVHPMTPTPAATETLRPVALSSVSATPTAVPQTRPAPTSRPPTSEPLETDPPAQTSEPILASETPTDIPVIAVSVAVNPAPTLAPTQAPAAPAAPSATSAPQAAAGPAVSADAAAAELYCVELINAQRANAGVPPLAAEEALMGIARARVADMVARNYTGHNDPVTGAALGPVLMQAAGYGYVGENWYGSLKAPPAIVDVAMGWFMTDAPHYRNILSPNYTAVGVGIAYNGRQWLLVQDFAGR